MKNLFLSALVMSLIIGCKTEQTPEPVPANQNVEALHQQFHGKYKIVSAVTSEPLDVNLDGTVSTNLLSEIDELSTGTLTSSYAEIRIYGPSPLSPEPAFLFTQPWPAQFLRMGLGKVWDGMEVIPFNAAYTFAYDMKVLIRKVEFSEDLRQLTVFADETEEPIYRESAPKSVTVQNDGKIVVVNVRKMYTSAGVKQVTVTTTYERFTMTT